MHPTHVNRREAASCSRRPELTDDFAPLSSVPTLELTNKIETELDLLATALKEMHPGLQDGASDQEIMLKQMWRKGSSPVLNLEEVNR